MKRQTQFSQLRLIPCWPNPIPSSQDDENRKDKFHTDLHWLHSHFSRDDANSTGFTEGERVKLRLHIKAPFTLEKYQFEEKKTVFKKQTSIHITGKTFT